MNQFNSQNPVSKSAPFGYKWRENQLVLNEREAPIRKQIYELFLAHQRKKTVARLLNEQGFRTRNDSLFADATIERLLKDTSAKGIYEIKSNGKIREIKISPIVSVEVWEQANAILRRKRKPLKKTANLFAGVIFCHCSGKMSVPSNSPKYICQSCRNKISTDDLEAVFAEQLKAFPIGVLGGADTGQANQSLFDYWQTFAKDEKRIIVEQLANRIIISRGAISIEFGVAQNSLKTVLFGQQTAENFSTAANQAELKKNNRSGLTEPITVNEPLMSEPEAAQFLGISKMTLLRKRNAGEIKFFRVGFRVLYSKEKHLLPFLEKCERETGKE